MGNAEFITATLLFQGDEVATSILGAWFSGDFIAALLALAAILAVAIWYLDRRNSKLVEQIIADQAKREAAMLERHEEREDAATIAAAARETQIREDQRVQLADQKALLTWIMDKQAEQANASTAAFKAMMAELKTGLSKDTDQLRTSIGAIVTVHEKWSEKITDTLGGFARNDAKIITVLDSMQNILKENREAQRLRLEFEEYKNQMQRSQGD